MNAGRGVSTPRLPMRLTNAASEGTAVPHMRHDEDGVLRWWCIAHSCPGARCLQHAGVSSAAADTVFAQHRPTGAAANPASWHASQHAAVHDNLRRNAFIRMRS